MLGTNASAIATRVCSDSTGKRFVLGYRSASGVAEVVMLADNRINQTAHLAGNAVMSVSFSPD